MMVGHGLHLENLQMLAIGKVATQISSSFGDHANVTNG